MCDILGGVRSLLHQPQSLKGAWLRGVVFPIRGVLEKEVDRFWEATFDGMKGANRSTKFICLKHLARDRCIAMKDELAGEVYSAWKTLSRACHYHGYDLTPTVSELKLWIDQVERLCKSLRTLHNNDTGEK